MNKLNTTVWCPTCGDPVEAGTELLAALRRVEADLNSPGNSDRCLSANTERDLRAAIAKVTGDNNG